MTGPRRGPGRVTPRKLRMYPIEGPDATRCATCGTVVLVTWFGKVPPAPPFTCEDCYQPDGADDE